jgi:hypothetical protein
MNTQNKEMMEKNSQTLDCILSIMGYILAIIGGLLISSFIFILLVLWISEGFTQHDFADLGVAIIFMFGEFLLLLGILILPLGIWLIVRKMYEIKRQLWDWVLVILGGLYLDASIIFIFLMLIESYLFGLYIGYIIVLITSICGVLLLVFGIRDILRKENNPTIDRGDTNNL